MPQESPMVEALAALEHEQWASWASKVITQNADLPPALAEKWRASMVPYATLPERVKEMDREWARRAIELIVPRTLHCGCVLFGHTAPDYIVECRLHENASRLLEAAEAAVKEGMAVPNRSQATISLMAAVHRAKGTMEDAPERSPRSGGFGMVSVWEVTQCQHRQAAIRWHDALTADQRAALPQRIWEEIQVVRAEEKNCPRCRS